MSGDSLPYRPCVGLMLLNREGLAFAGQRFNAGTHAWQMPQGGIDEGESPREAALRELEEEVGTDRVKVLAESRAWHRYDLPAALQGRIWGGRYRGQEQKWFAMLFLGTDADIDLEAHHAEFRAWQWVPVVELPKLVIDFKRPVYEAVVAEFLPLVEQMRKGRIGDDQA